MGMIERIALAVGFTLILGALAFVYWPLAPLVAGAVLVALAVAP